MGDVFKVTSWLQREVTQNESTLTCLPHLTKISGKQVSKLWLQVTQVQNQLCGITKLI